MRFITVAVTLVAMTVTAARAQDWPQWRGPDGDNHAAAGATAPIQWSESEGLAWMTLIPGRGNSSPTIVGKRVYLTTSDRKAQTQSLLILDCEDGHLIKETVVHRGGLTKKIHRSNTDATPTVASDGKHVFALFHNGDAAWVTAFDLDGDQLWQQRAIGFDLVKYDWGFGSSPVIVDGLVIVASESGGPEHGIVALDCATGERVWHTPRPQLLHSYSTPARVTIDDKTQLLMTGIDQVASYDAATGAELWSTPGSTHTTCGTMVWDQKLGLAFGSGGYPEKFTLAVKLDGDHAIVWHNAAKCYEQSLLAHDGYVYGLDNSGVGYCWRAADGKQMWKQRIGKKSSSSPLLVNGNIYVTSEKGETLVYAANPERFEELSRNQLGDRAFATLTPSHGRLYHRFSQQIDGRIQDYLAAIGD